MARSILSIDGRLIWWCAGCKGHHGVRVQGGPAPLAYANEPTWTWNGREDLPTLSPSIRIQGPPQTPNGPNPSMCHFHVVNGRIEYLADCTHAFAGAHVDMDDLQLPGLPGTGDL